MVDYITHVVGMLKRRWSNEFHEENSRTYLFKYKFRLVFRRRSRWFGLRKSCSVTKPLATIYFLPQSNPRSKKSMINVFTIFIQLYHWQQNVFTFFTAAVAVFEIFSYWLIQLLYKLLLIKTAFLVAINIARLPTHAKNTATIGN